MSEKAPSPEVPEPRIASPEEASAGFYLQPTEAVAVDLPANSASAMRTYDMGRGVKVQGRHVAEMRIGGAETFATGTVIRTHDGLTLLSISQPDTPDTFTIGLEQGQLWGIGRRFEGQDRLPGTVSGDHCAVGLDEENRLVIENHAPTNLTGLRTF